MSDIIAYEPDLLFASRIEGAAAKAGINIEIFSDLDQLGQRLKESTPRIVILNLDAAEGKLGALEPFIKIVSFKAVGYYSHVNAGVGEEARRIGIGIVLSRGAFAARISELLKELSSG